MSAESRAGTSQRRQAARPRSPATRAQETRDHVLVLLGLARAGAVDQGGRRARRAVATRLEQIASCIAASAGNRPARAASGCPDRAGRCRDPSTARRSSTRSNEPSRKGSGPDRRCGRPARWPRAHRPMVVARAAARERAARRSRRRRPRRPHWAARRERLAAGRRAQRRARADPVRAPSQLRDDLRRFVLHHAPPVAKGAPRPARARRARPGRAAQPPSASVSTPSRAQPLGQVVAVPRSRLAARVNAGGSLLKRSHVLRRRLRRSDRASARPATPDASGRRTEVVSAHRSSSTTAPASERARARAPAAAGRR